MQPVGPIFEIRGSRKTGYHHALVAVNGETLTSSETFTRKSDAKRAIKDTVNSFLGALGPEGVAIRDATTK